MNNRICGYTFALAFVLCAPCVAQAQDTPQSMHLEPADVPASAGNPAPVPQKQPQIDPSRSVTLTGQELQAYVSAAVALAQAQEASQVASPVVKKVREALSGSNNSTDRNSDEWSSTKNLPAQRSPLQ